MAQVAADISDLASIIQWLDGRGRLVRVRSEVDPAHQLAGIAAKFERGPRAVLFERVRGSAFPVFTGLYWSRELLGELFGKPVLSLPQYVAECIRDWQVNPVAPVLVRNGPVREVTEDAVDLSILPVPTHAELDGGPTSMPAW
jgi:2,5-furandicarboxylate decarboxylase 1